MKRFLRKFKPADVIALVIVCGGFALKFFGADGLVGTLLMAVSAYYFGAETLTKNDVIKPPDKIEEGGVAGLIERVANDYGIDSDLAVKVAECESALDSKATNINDSGSVDRGLFQWNDKWHPEVSDECAFDPECSTKAFCLAVEKGHLDWWNATKGCWNK